MPQKLSMKYPIYVIGHEILRKEGRNIDIETEKEEISELITDMFDAMKESEGVGLAAQQIGKSLKLFLVDASPLADELPELADFKHAFINAVITERKGDIIKMNEGCLSIPGLREDVWRHDEITIKYIDENFQEQENTFSGYVARIIQHEYDHTYGILFTDRISKVRKALIQNKIKAMALGKFKASYKTVLGNKKTSAQYLFRNVKDYISSM